MEVDHQHASGLQVHVFVTHIVEAGGGTVVQPRDETPDLERIARIVEDAATRVENLATQLENAVCYESSGEKMHDFA